MLGELNMVEQRYQTALQVLGPVVDGPGCRSLLALPKCVVDLKQLLVGADHEVRGD
jgi:hypothetical protein